MTTYNAENRQLEKGRRQGHGRHTVLGVDPALLGAEPVRLSRSRRPAYRRCRAASWEGACARVTRAHAVDDEGSIAVRTQATRMARASSHAAIDSGGRPSPEARAWAREDGSEDGDDRGQQGGHGWAPGGTPDRRARSDGCRVGAERSRTAPGGPLEPATGAGGARGRRYARTGWAPWTRRGATRTAGRRGRRVPDVRRTTA